MVGSPSYVTNWRKAGRCIGDACVEVACTSARVVVRDSANLAGRVVAYPPNPWRGFIALAEEAKQRGWWEDYRRDSHGYLQVRRPGGGSHIHHPLVHHRASMAASGGRLREGHSQGSARFGASGGDPDDSPGFTHREPPLDLAVVMDESVLLREVGSAEVMCVQLETPGGRHHAWQCRECRRPDEQLLRRGRDRHVRLPSDLREVSRVAPHTKTPLNGTGSDRFAKLAGHQALERSRKKKDVHPSLLSHLVSARCAGARTPTVGPTATASRSRESATTTSWFGTSRTLTRPSSATSGQCGTPSLGGVRNGEFDDHEAILPEVSQ